MKRTVILLFAGLGIFVNSYSICKQDSIYRDLYAFLVSRNVIPEDIVPEFGSENYGAYIYVFNVLHDDFPNKPDLTAEFGVYKFNFSGCNGCGFYVLIIHEDSYKVFQQDALTLILDELLQIKRKNPELIPEEVFYNYLSELLKIGLGIYGKFVMMQKIGKIEYYFGR
jgi:hypothetical protein